MTELTKLTIAQARDQMAFGMDENTDDPVTMWLNDVFTIPTSLAGLPLGLQLIGRPFDEETVFKVAGVMESAAQFTAVPEGV